MFGAAYANESANMAKIECFAREKSGVNYITLSPVAQRMTKPININLLDALVVIALLTGAGGLLKFFLN
jgi:hypothetical protein